MQSLNVDYKSNPYRWEVALTPKGARMYEAGPRGVSSEEIDVLSYLENTRNGREELNTLGYELKYPHIKQLAHHLNQLGLVSVRFIHDMGSKFDAV